MEKTVKIWGKEITPYETFHVGVTEAFFRGVLGGGISRTVKCDDSLAIMVENEKEMENEVKVIGKLSSSQDAVVVDSSGISPTHTSGHGNCPKIIEPPAVIDNLGSYKPNGYNASCVVGSSGIAPTVRENHGEVTAVLEPKIIGYTRDREKGKVVKRTIKDESGTIHSSTGGGGNTSQFVLEPKYRIRKLTERECFRLMDVDDADIDKMQSAGISKSQQYKLAGNSIAISPLYHIFRKMFVDKDNEQQQLTLF